MTDRPRIYLDHAATGWPKSPAVAQAMTHVIDNVGAAAGRGVYDSAIESTRIVNKLRGQLANLIGAESSDCITLHCSGTAALNAGLLGLVRPGDHVVTTASEHNSVLRPLDHLRTTAGVQLDIVPPASDARHDAASILDRVRPDTAAVVVTGASNVTGIAMPIAEIAASLTDHPAMLIVDAAQTFGWLPIDVRVGIDVLAAPGHKAAGGPLGTGFLYVAPALHQAIRPTIFGGTGSSSESVEMPTAMPDKLESGNLNVPAIAGWSAGLPNTDHINRRLTLAGELSEKLHNALERSGCHKTPIGDLPIVSFWSDDLDAAELAILLSTEFGIEVRSGHHCAARIVQTLGGPPSGVARASAGPETTDAEIAALSQAITEILAPPP